MFLWKCQSFRDRKRLHLRGTRTPNLRTHAKCSNHLSYQGQVFEYWLWRYIYFFAVKLTFEMLTESGIYFRLTKWCSYENVPGELEPSTYVFIYIYIYVFLVNYFRFSLLDTYLVHNSFIQVHWQKIIVSNHIWIQCDREVRLNYKSIKFVTRFPSIYEFSHDL